LLTFSIPGLLPGMLLKTR